MRTRVPRCECGECGYCRKRVYLKAYYRANREKLKVASRENYHARKADDAEAEFARQKRYRENRRDARLAEKREWYWADPDKSREYQREINRANREKYAPKMRAYYREHRERELANARVRVEQNPASARLAKRRYKARVKGAPFTEAAGEWVRVLEGDPCSYCGGPCEHIDHIEPLVRSGNSDWVNLTASCASCNQSKMATPLLRWLARSDRRLVES